MVTVEAEVGSRASVEAELSTIAVDFDVGSGGTVEAVLSHGGTVEVELSTPATVEATVATGAAFEVALSGGGRGPKGDKGDPGESGITGLRWDEATEQDGTITGTLVVEGQEGDLASLPMLSSITYTRAKALWRSAHD